MKIKRVDLYDLIDDCGSSTDHLVYQVLRNLLYEDKMKLSLDEGPWIAGGIITCLLTNQHIEHKQGKRDFDFWFTDKTQARIWNSEYNFGQDPYSTEKANTFKVKKFGTELLFQYIHGNTFSSPANLLGSFDFSVCQFVTDGQEVLTTDQAIQDIKEYRLNLNYPWKSSNLPERFVKYTCQYDFNPEPDVLRRMVESISMCPKDFKKVGDSGGE